MIDGYSTIAELGLNAPLAVYNVNQLDSYVAFSQDDNSLMVAKSRVMLVDNQSYMMFKKPVKRKIQKDENDRFVLLNKQKCYLSYFKTV